MLAYFIYLKWNNANKSAILKKAGNGKIMKMAVSDLHGASPAHFPFFSIRFNV